MNDIYSSFDFNNSTTLRIHESGYANLSVQKNWSVNKPPFSRLYYMEDGEAEIIADGKHILLKKGYVYMFPTGYSLKNISTKPMKQLFFHINMPDYGNHDILTHCKICDGIPTNDISKLVSMYQSRNLIDILKLKQRTSYDCIQFLEMSNCTLSNKVYSEVVKKSIKYINHNLSANMKVCDICKIVHTSKGTLNNAFKSELGKSVGEFIDHTVLEKSRVALITTSSPIGTISDELGFCDQFYFSRKFKEKYHQTPTEYRRKNFTR